MPDALMVRDREYGSPETALLSTAGLARISEPHVGAGTGAVFSTPPSRSRARPQISCGSKNRMVRVSNATLPLPTWFRPSLTALVDLLNLPPGWNSHSAKPIKPENVAAAVQLLGALLGSDMPPPTVVPRVKGNIQLEWHTKRIDIEVYIDSPNRVHVLAEDVSDGEVAEGSLAGREGELKNWLKRLSSD